MSAHNAESVLAMLERRDVITTDPNLADRCCGMMRDTDGFCQHRPYHPIYVSRIDGSFTNDESLVKDAAE